MEEAVGDAHALVFGHFVWLAFAQAGGELSAHFLRCLVEQRAFLLSPVRWFRAAGITRNRADDDAEDNGI